MSCVSSGPAPEALKAFLDAVIDCSEHLALPLPGGPTPQRADTLQVGRTISRDLDNLLQRGVRAWTVRADATASGVIIAGAALAQAQLPAATWRHSAGRLAAFLVDGLAPSPAAARLPPP